MSSSRSIPDWKISNERTIVFDRPFLVGILNITPDSFSDGGEIDSVQSAVDRALKMRDEGADALDIGGESTRPGAKRVDERTQCERVVPVVEGIRAAGIDLVISVDTTLSGVARDSLNAGADVINDVSAGVEDQGMFELALEKECGLVLMHRVVIPEQDQYSDQYSDRSHGRPIDGGAMARVSHDLCLQRDRALAMGVDSRSIVLDPGLGFGKDVEQNLDLIRECGVICELGHPVMSALSRKSFVGRVSLDRDSDPSERLMGTVGLSVMHLAYGAHLFRVHDVGVHREALDAAWRVGGGERSGG